MSCSVSLEALWLTGIPEISGCGVQYTGELLGAPEMLKTTTH